MKKAIKPSEKPLPQNDPDKNSPSPESLMRREALKRIAFMALGSVAGATLIAASCIDGDGDSYDDYDDYSDYYSNYYSNYSNSYYDYYSVYSVYWD